MAQRSACLKRGQQRTYWTAANKSYRPGTPLSSYDPRSENFRPVPATRSVTTLEELSPKVGDGGNREGGISWGCLTPPLLHRRSDMPCPTITSPIIYIQETSTNNSPKHST